MTGSLSVVAKTTVFLLLTGTGVFSDISGDSGGDSDGEYRLITLDRIETHIFRQTAADKFFG